MEEYKTTIRIILFLIPIIAFYFLSGYLKRLGETVGSEYYWRAVKSGILVSFIFFPILVFTLLMMDVPRNKLFWNLLAWFPSSLFGSFLLTFFLFLRGGEESVKITNERLKLTAAACDRASTALFTVGVAAPLATLLYAPATANSDSNVLQLGITTCVLVGVCLHLIARRLLGGLRDEG